MRVIGTIEVKAARDKAEIVVRFQAEYGILWWKKILNREFFWNGMFWKSTQGPAVSKQELRVLGQVTGRDSGLHKLKKALNDES